MHTLKLFLLLFLIGVNICFVSGQTQQSKLQVVLADMGFENIRMLEHNDSLILAVENNVYRWNIKAIEALLDSAAVYAPNKQLKLYFLQNDIPALQLEVALAHWQYFRETASGSPGLQESLVIERSIDDTWKNLKGRSPLRSQMNKIDFVLYPQLRITNRLLTQLYEVQFNIAPAMEVVLWKGMQFTGQVIFPIINDVEIEDTKENVEYGARNFLITTDEGHYIRPGFITLSQDFRLQNRWSGNVTLGKFNTYRYGLSSSIVHYFKKNKWSITGQLGLTGSSHFIDGTWNAGKMDKLNAAVTVAYFYPQYNLETRLTMATYLNHDKGVRMDCIRRFSETAIGFYAMYSGEKMNGGFKFTIPFPGTKRRRKHNLRCRLPYYFDSDYNAGYAVYYGKEFETRPNENLTENFTNPLFIKNQILTNSLYK